MANFEITRPALGTASFGSFASRMMATVVAWNDARVTRNALSTLSDRELDDIGLIRGDIDGVASSNFIR